MTYIFYNFAGKMKVLTAHQMRELDKFTILDEPVTGLDLMERASMAVSEELMRRWGVDTRFVVFAGPGNNGGDALAVSRMLVRNGYCVEVYLINVGGRLSADCHANWLRLTEMIAPNVDMVEDGGDATAGEDVVTQCDRLVLHEVKQGFDFPRLKDDDIIIDGLFGTGLSRPIDGGFASLTCAINTCGCRIVSIDMPSGLMSEENTYNDMRKVVRATLTLTMHRPKPAQLLDGNLPYVGELVVLPIGLSAEREAAIVTAYNITEEDGVRKMLRHRPLYAHKGMMGHALLVAGSRGMAGAAIMAARACLRGGVGKVTVATASVNVLPLQATVPEAIVHALGGPLPDDFTDRFQAIGIGPGMGVSENGGTMLHIMRNCTMPMVIDADAITLIGKHREWLRHIPKDSILTPHPIELDRIVGTCSDDWVRLSRARQLARDYHLHVLVKGHRSAVVMPTGDVWFNATGNAGMATAGSGDVLTGLLTALLAQGYPSGDALRLGVWLHGRAGDMAVMTVGSQEALIASDIVAHIGHAFKSLETR